MSLHVDHIGISVADLDAQLAWYREALDLESANAFEIAPAGLRGAFLLGPDGIAIELLEKSGSHPAGPLPKDPPSALLQRGYRHLCFRVDDLDAVYAALTAVGASIVSAPSPSPEPGVRFFFAADPEGNLLEFVDRPTSVEGAAG